VALYRLGPGWEFGPNWSRGIAAPREPMRHEAFGRLIGTGFDRVAWRFRERCGANRKGPENLNDNKPRLTDPTQRSCRRPVWRLHFLR